MNSLYIRVPTARLIRFINPLTSAPWGCNPITKKEVLAAAAARRFETKPWDSVKGEPKLLRELGRDFHIGRVAWMVINGIPRDQEIVAVLSPYAGGSSIHQGNHRVAAAHVRGRRLISLRAFSEAADLDAMFEGKWKVVRPRLTKPGP